MLVPVEQSKLEHRRKRNTFEWVEVAVVVVGDMFNNNKSGCVEVFFLQQIKQLCFLLRGVLLLGGSSERRV